MSPENFLETLKKESIEYVDFRFTDIDGKLHHITYRSSHINEATLTHGVGFDGSSIDGWKKINESDMVLIPDLSSAFIDPFTEAATICLFCDVIDPKDGRNYSRDPRSIAKAAVAYAKKLGLADAIYVGPELEFFVFDDIRFENQPYHSSFSIDSDEAGHNTGREFIDGNLGHRPGTKGGYFPVQPVDSFFDLRSEMCSKMAEVGLTPTLHHHEVAAAQCEIGIEFSDILGSADNVQKFKYIVKNVALENDRTATFMPKPIYGDNGSGMHTHLSFWKNGENLFYQKGSYGDLSEIALYAIGGIIKHAKAINAFSNPSTNSYKRLVPGFEAPVSLAYSARNRSAAIRIPHVFSSKAKRFEARFPDPSCNPYLSFTVLVLAALDGIKNKIHPGAAQDRNLYDLSEKDKKKIPSVSGSLREALENLSKDRKFIIDSGVMDNDFIDNYIKLKMSEVLEFEMAPHPIEFKLYYSC